VCVFTSFPLGNALCCKDCCRFGKCSFATLMGAESFWLSSILVILIIVHVILTVFNFPPNNFVHICGHCYRSNASTVDCTGSRILSNCVSSVCVFTSFSYRETLSAAKTVAVLANSFATLIGAESFWWSSILVFNYCPHHFDCL
jgi:hypothetical protein